MRVEDRRKVDKFIKSYILGEIKLKVLRLNIDNLDSEILEEKINTLCDSIELVRDNIEEDYLLDLDLLFRYSFKEITEISSYYTKERISYYRKKVREEFYKLMVQEGLI